MNAREGAAAAEAAAVLAGLIGKGAGASSALCIEFGGSALHVDGGSILMEKGRERRATASIWSIAPDDLMRFLKGEVNAQMLILSKRLKIAGRMGPALAFARLIETRLHGSSALPE